MSETQEHEPHVVYIPPWAWSNTTIFNEIEKIPSFLIDFRVNESTAKILGGTTFLNSVDHKRHVATARQQSLFDKILFDNFIQPSDSQVGDFLQGYVKITNQHTVVSVDVLWGNPNWGTTSYEDTFYIIKYHDDKEHMLLEVIEEFNKEFQIKLNRMKNILMSESDNGLLGTDNFGL